MSDRLRGVLRAYLGHAVVLLVIALLLGTEFGAAVSWRVLWFLFLFSVGYWGREVLRWVFR